MWSVVRDKSGRRAFAALLSERPLAPALIGATLLVGLAALIRYGFEFIAPGLPPYPTFLVAVLFAALLLSTIAGLFAMLLGVACSAWLLIGTQTTAAQFAASTVLFVAASLVLMWGAGQCRKLVNRAMSHQQLRDRNERLLVNQNEILARIAASAPLSEVFEKLIGTIEEFSDHAMLGSILLLDRDGVHLRVGAAPSLPSAYNAAIEGASIGPAAGSCGTAAYRKAPVFVTDIEHDPLWAGYKDLALKHGLRACWSTPIMSRSARVLGTFAIYYREKRSPSQDDLDIIAYVSRTAALAIDRNQIETQREMLIK